MCDTIALRNELVKMGEQLQTAGSVEVTDKLRAVFPCFSPEKSTGHASVKPEDFDTVIASLDSTDIPTIDAAIAAIDEGRQAWIGFKIVTDPDSALVNEVTDFSSTFLDDEIASADNKPLMFFATEEHDIVSSRPYSKRDRFQMLDITRGPHMHADQFESVAWVSRPLMPSERVFVMGAGPVGLEVAALAAHVGFTAIAVDYDPLHLSEERFPTAERVLLDGFDDISSLGVGPKDYVLVLTRGHAYDPEVLVQALETNAHYVGMIGTGSKNNKAFRKARERGVTDEQLETVFTPIGIKCGAKTPAELAVSIVAELIAQRAKPRPVCHQW